MVILDYNPTRREELPENSKVFITHIGNAINTNILYSLEYGKVWEFNYQIASLTAPLELPVPIFIPDKLVLKVSNTGGTDFDAEAVLVGFYETEIIK